MGPIRQKLSVIEVQEPRKIGDKGAEMLCFKGKDSEAKVFTYCTFTKALFEAIKGAQGKELDADVEVSTREVNGTTYTDHKVSQVYVNGEPVFKAPPKQGNRFSESPEARASIESQVAVKAVVDLMLAKVIPLNHPLSMAATQWMKDRLPKVPDRT